MPQIFHRSANTLSKLSLAGLLIVVAGLFTIAGGLRENFGSTAFMNSCDAFLRTSLASSADALAETALPDPLPRRFRRRPR